jgi:hypothetical protein
MQCHIVLCRRPGAGSRGRQPVGGGATGTSGRADGRSGTGTAARELPQRSPPPPPTAPLATGFSAIFTTFPSPRARGACHRIAGGIGRKNGLYHLFLFFLSGGLLRRTTRAGPAPPGGGPDRGPSLTALSVGPRAGPGPPGARQGPRAPPRPWPPGPTSPRGGRRAAAVLAAGGRPGETVDSAIPGRPEAPGGGRSDWSGALRMRSEDAAGWSKERR